MMASVSAAAVFKDSPDLSGTHSAKYQTGDADQSKLLTHLLKRAPETATQGGQASYSLCQGCATSIFSISLLENI